MGLNGMERNTMALNTMEATLTMVKANQKQFWLLSYAFESITTLGLWAQVVYNTLNEKIQKIDHDIILCYTGY